MEAVPLPTIFTLPRYFICETMITAGPRKKYTETGMADRDLGEDVCGFICRNDQAFLWLLDGTSDLHCLVDPNTNQEYFSSRMLGLGIAEKLKNRLLIPERQDLSLIVPEIIEELRQDWIKNITALPQQEHDFLQKNIRNKNFPECAATIFVARLDISGDLHAYRAGDSKAFVYSRNDENTLRFEETPLCTTNTNSNDRIFFRLVLNDDDSYNIVSNALLYETVNRSKVDQLIYFSDGISAESEQLLKFNFPRDPASTRSQLLLLSQKTGDDKAICFVQIQSP